MKARYFFVLVPVVIGLLLSFQLTTTAEPNYLQPAGSGQIDEDLAEVGSRVSTFLRDLVGGRTESAFDDLLEASPLQNDAERVTQLKIQVGQFENRFGEAIRGEKIRLEPLGASMIRAVYLMHNEDFPVVWRVTFHRSDTTGEWRVVSISYDTNYEGLPASEAPPRLLPR